MQIDRYTCTHGHVHGYWLLVKVLRPTLWIVFSLTGPISLCLDSLLYMYYFVHHCILHECVGLSHGKVDLGD